MENENNYKKRYKNAKNRSDIDLSDIDFESSVAYDFDKQRRREKRKNSKGKRRKSKRELLLEEDEE